ncbi:hypothetical protein [Castellaniella sp.]|uniref:hypothetical protein n=1 Tax=Castellaniella sp. TaxID=1955812 RepID=UPI002AFEF8A9|nr:hypothetical protein [Castellaniella sp.]
MSRKIAWAAAIQNSLIHGGQWDLYDVTMPKDPAALLREIQHPPQISHRLLQLFVIALISCSLLAVRKHARRLPRSDSG